MWKHFGFGTIDRNLSDKVKTVGFMVTLACYSAGQTTVRALHLSKPNLSDVITVH